MSKQPTERKKTEKRCQKDREKCTGSRKEGYHVGRDSCEKALKKELLLGLIVEEEAHGCFLCL